ncbi:hypothetical protein [Candidatus Leptofilum sp.]|uniref:hypothetical protein n=1 Tax=Candidatus Leptofilum sp. TaxID=3241576 RepID=UPI003B5ABBBF
MVHALKQIQGLLKVGNGRLIDIHPNGEPPPIFVRLNDERHLTGWIQEESDYVSYTQAEDALREAVQYGWYHQEARKRITFATYATDLEALREHLHQNWKGAWIEDLVAMQINNRLNSLAHEKEIIVEEQIWLSRYQPSSG